MRMIFLAAALLLAACSDIGSEEAPKERQSAAATQAPSPVPSAVATPAQTRLVEETDDIIEFTYGWSAEAAAVPELAARFEADLAKWRAESRKTAEEDRDARGPEIPFHGHLFSKTWTTMGSTPRLLSLAADLGTFTGGAHGNSIYEALLWDRQGRREIEVEALFADPAAAWRLMQPVYCAELDRQRAEKREETLPLEGEGWMVECRPVAEQVVAPVDEDKDGRFERLRVLLEPYNSGPYAEGSYEVDVPVTAALRALVKAEYRESF
jgi:hypothetical protein